MFDSVISCVSAVDGDKKQAYKKKGIIQLEKGLFIHNFQVVSSSSSLFILSKLELLSIK